MAQLILKGSAPCLNIERPLGEEELDYVMLNLPFKCNFKCTKCCNRLRQYKKGRLKLEQIKDFLLKCKPLGARVLVMAGEGEPTLDRNFREIVAFANEIGLTPYVFTNGSMLDVNLSGFLAENNTSLIVNIDFLEEEEYDKCVGRKGAYKRLMENLRITRAIYRPKMFNLGSYKVTFLAINLVLNNRNFCQIEPIKKFCGDDILFVVNRPIEIGAASKFWEEFDRTDRLVIDTEVSYPLGTLGEGKQCAYCEYGVSVGSDGRILTCAYALETQFYGDINDDIRFLRKKVLESVDEFHERYG